MQPARDPRKPTGPPVYNTTATFGDLPEPLRKVIFVVAFSDVARWWPAESRAALRLVCREARDAVDATRQRIGDVASSDKAAALARAVAAGRFALRELRVGDPHNVDPALTVRDVFELFEASWDKLEKLCLCAAFGPRKVMALASSAARLPELRELRFQDSEVGDAGVQALVQVTWPHLVALEVTGDVLGVSGVAALAGAAPLRLPELRELVLCGNDSRAESIAALVAAYWPHLEVLDCAGNRISGVGATSLAAARAAGRLPQLRELHIGSNEVGDDLHMLLSTDWPLLEVLGLQWNGIGSAGIAAMVAASARLPKLRELNLRRNALDGEALAALSQGTWPQLRTLKLGGTGLSAAGAAALGSGRPEVMKALVELDMGGHGSCLVDFGMARCWRGLCLARLEILLLGRCQIRSFEAELLAQANSNGALPALRVLDLSNNVIGDVEALAATPWHRLEELDLSWNRLDITGNRSADSLAAAAAGQRFPALKSLALKWNCLDGEHFFEKLAAVAWPRLQTLDLAGNSITPAIASRGLGNFPALQTLQLGGHHFLDECEAKQLLAAWPRLQLVAAPTISFF